MKQENVARHFGIKQVVLVLATILVCKTLVFVVILFGDYFPPNFQSDFLLGRRTYFFGAYRWAFYAHIISGPISLVLGMLLLSGTLRRRYPIFHRNLGKIQIVGIVFVMCPSGLWMAWYAATGRVAAFGFGTLAIVTAATALLGWRSAVQRRFKQHRLWMLRCFVLLCSAVVLRVIGGLSVWYGNDSTYPFAAWISWLFPLFLFDLVRVIRRMYLAPPSSTSL